jgi:hypothetical protein
MPRPQRNLDSADRRFAWTDGTTVLAVHGIVLAILACLALSSPHAIESISESVQAEFVGSDAPVVQPTRLAQPAGDIWTVGAH